MPTYDYICEVCGTPGRAWRQEGPPRFCSMACRGKGFKGKGGAPKYIITPEMHERIREVYQTGTGKSQVNELADELGLPRWKISRYALLQGFVARKKKEANWSGRELRILESSAHLTPERIQLRLKKAGDKRSLLGIVLKRKRMRFLQNMKGQSATSLALCFGVDVKVITRWISRGYLKAVRRGTKRTSRQGGDMWFIRDRWIRDFIINSLDEIDLRKVDKYWFVDLVAGGNYGVGECKTNKTDDIMDDVDGLDDTVDPEVTEIFTEAANW